MNISIQDFKNTSSAILEAIKHVDHIHIELPHYVYGNCFKSVFNFSQIRFRNVAKLYRYVKHLPVDIYNAELAHNRVHADFWAAIKRGYTHGEKTLVPIQKDHVQSFEGLRLVPEAIDKKHRPLLLQNAPIETTEAERTYRGITWRSDASEDELVMLSADNDQIYDYLDKGYFIMFCEKTSIKGKLEKSVVVSDRYDVNTAHIFAMCWLQPSLAEMLKNKCFINHREAEMLKLRMAKKMHISNKSAYAKISEAIETDYRSNSTLVMIAKLLDGSVAKTTINEIEFTKTTATYERISVEHESLLNILQATLNFNSEFDIYTICNILGNQLQAKSDDTIRPQESTDPRITLPKVSINGIDIVVSIAYTGCRYINDIRVNKDEVGAAVSRASCYHDPEGYKVFLETIRSLSIKHHDIIANGLPVKIHSNITYDEYSQATPGPAAPTIKFKITKDTNRVHLEVSPTKSVPVHFQKIINRVATLNERTDNKNTRQKLPGYHYATNVSRNYRWAAKQMIDILVSACTFTDEIVDADGNKRKTTKVYISEDDVTALLDAANENKRAAIARSREFMEMAVKSTGAEKIDFLGQPAYKVVGKMRTYAVIIKSAKVYDFETKKYRCIVNHNHYQGAGYDDVATRLLALKNDSLTQESIGTLQGEAQPHYEPLNNNANMDEREAVVDDDVRQAINRAFSSV